MSSQASFLVEYSAHNLMFASSRLWYRFALTVWSTWPHAAGQSILSWRSDGIRRGEKMSQRTILSNIYIHCMQYMTHALFCCSYINSHVSGRLGCDFKNTKFKVILLRGISRSFYDNELLLNLCDGGNKFVITILLAYYNKINFHSNGHTAGLLSISNVRLRYVLPLFLMFYTKSSVTHACSMKYVTRDEFVLAVHSSLLNNLVYE